MIFGCKIKGRFSRFFLGYVLPANDEILNIQGLDNAGNMAKGPPFFTQIKKNFQEGEWDERAIKTLNHGEKGKKPGLKKKRGP